MNLVYMPGLRSEGGSHLCGSDLVNVATKVICLITPYVDYCFS